MSGSEQEELFEATLRQILARAEGDVRLLCSMLSLPSYATPWKDAAVEMVEEFRDKLRSLIRGGYADTLKPSAREALRCASEQLADELWKSELVDRFTIAGGLRVDFPEITGTGRTRQDAVDDVAEQARALINERLEAEGREERWTA